MSTLPGKFAHVLKQPSQQNLALNDWNLGCVAIDSFCSEAPKSAHHYLRGKK